MMATLTNLPCSGSRVGQRGGAYVFFLGFCLIITVMGLGALTLTRISGRTANGQNDWENAGTLAFSATEQALAYLNSIAATKPLTWRSTYTSGQVAFTTSMNGGTLSWALKDETDGNLNADPLRPFRIYGIGQSHGVTRVYSVQIVPAGSALDVLRTAVHGDRAVQLTSNVRAVNGPASSDTSVSLSGTVNGAIEAPSISGSASGTQTKTVTAAKQMPSSAVLAQLTPRATTIAFSSLSSGKLQNCLLSSTVNSYGTVASNGVYLINLPQGESLTISNCRIAATLLISGAGSNTIKLNGPVRWDPPSADMPAMVISASGAQVNITGSDTWLSESSVGANLNPASTPYNGSSNTTSTDDYPPQYRGVFHIIAGSSGQVNCSSNCYFVGTLIADCPIKTSNQSTFVQDPTIQASPPSGYALGDVLAINPGTWRWDGLP